MVTAAVTLFFLFCLQIGVHIFTRRPLCKDLSQLKPDDVITYLGKHNQALLLYLEHLVLERRIQVGYGDEAVSC